MSRPLIVFLQLLALILILHGASTGNVMSFIWAAICFFPAAIAIRERMKR